jgi:crotonobetaine/carnitine-CoA ligase
MGLLSEHGNRTLYDVLRGHAEREPERTWLTFERSDGAERTWTYAEFAEEVDAAAGKLGALGLSPGDTFVVCLDNHPELIRLILAASTSGRIAIPADTRLTWRELGDYFDVSEAKLLFTREEHGEARAAAEEHGASVVFVGDPFDDPGRSDRPEARAGSPGGVFELLFTSGTTSRPKGVMLTSRAVAHGADVLARAAGYRSSDTPLVALPLYHAAAQMHQLWPTLLLGGRAVVVERFAPTRFFAQAARLGATTSAHFAATLRLLLRRGNAADARRSGLRHVTFAQSLSAEEYAEWDARYGVPLQHLWGMTETVGLPLMSPLAGDRRLETMGRPVSGYEVVVSSSGGEPVTPGEPGEIIVRAEPGANVTLGYYGNPEATAELFRDGWLRTGDVATVDEEGFVSFLGRRRDIIRRAGTNFSALEIEEVVRRIAGVLDVAVVAVDDALGDQSVAVFVVRDGERPTADEVRAHCRATLAAFKRPQVVEFVAELPQTAVGKVRKHLLVPSPKGARQA